MIQITTRQQGQHSITNDLKNVDLDVEADDSPRTNEGKHELSNGIHSPTLKQLRQQRQRNQTKYLKSVFCHPISNSVDSEGIRVRIVPQHPLLVLRGE